MPQVYNRHHDNAPDDAVYIGRGSPFGNPFAIGVHGDRNEVLFKFQEFLQGNPRLMQRIKDELRGKDLVCYCAPSSCHGDTLLALANDLPLPSTQLGLF